MGVSLSWSHGVLLLLLDDDDDDDDGERVPPLVLDPNSQSGGSNAAVAAFDSYETRRQFHSESATINFLSKSVPDDEEKEDRKSEKLMIADVSFQLVGPPPFCAIRAAAVCSCIRINIEIIFHNLKLYV